MAMSRSTAAATLQGLFECVVEEFDRDAPINQPYAFVRIAAAGGDGLDQNRLQNDMELSSAGISRLVQALSKVHYSKEKEGFDLVQRTFAPHDNRSRQLVLTPKGERVLGKLINIITGGK